MKSARIYIRRYTKHIEGVSALKALQIANDEGIPIYTINQSNISTILPQLQLSSDVISDIQNAVNAGDIVTVSKNEITYNGWTGVGYVIIDPTTGSGAYMISGGLGGWIIALKTIALFLLIVLVSIAIVAAGPEIAAFLTVFTETLGELPAALATFVSLLEKSYEFVGTVYGVWIASGVISALFWQAFEDCYEPEYGSPDWTDGLCMVLWLGDYSINVVLLLLYSIP